MFKNWKKSLFILMLVSLFAISMLGCEEETPVQPQEPAPAPAPVEEKPEFAKKELILATTTSTNDTGLLEALLPKFEEQTGLEVKVISVGTGQAIELGQNGDADVILVHARTSEDKFVNEGYGVNRRDVMYNDFVVIGPKEDPAGVKGLSIEEAFAKFVEGNAKFISRGDDSGTHKKELEVWKSVNIEPAGEWYLSIGKGMGDTINTANEMLGYTLTDRGTFIKMEKNIDLEIVIEGAEQLLNPYGVIPVNQEKHADVNYEGAEAFAEFITSAEGKAIINGFMLEGKQLFFAE